MIFFVVYNGDTEKDPLDHGVEDFQNQQDAQVFAETCVNKGMTVTIFVGRPMTKMYQRGEE